ncbi:hypothetical protein [Arthrobacter sp.]|uniref:hypothetical protein n=1 Tax=Arthrobacter sp. TaxID=1667 RepID=UPI002811FF05|nr:hypothetical protein [Arthrobacter sp.]
MEYLTVLLPSLAVGLIFYFVMKAIFNADRAEREAESVERTNRENAITKLPPEEDAAAEEK